jgi:hypothetical protein
MANLIKVSPGVYFKENDLSFVTRNIGVTTLGLVGETVKGPAFEPIFVENYGQFQTLFGGQNTEKYGDGRPRYELPYIAREYLAESNQLYVVRVLGYSGYEETCDGWTISVSGATGYDDQVVAVLRSRRLSSPTECYTTGLTLNITGSTFTGATSNVLNVFELIADTIDGVKTYTVSLDKNSPSYIVNVLGNTPKGNNTALWVEEIYPNSLAYFNGQSLLSGLTLSSVSSINTINNYKTQWQTPESPWILSEVRGTEIFKLFKFISISDGDNANREIKITIENIDPELKEFDVVIRSFFDTDNSINALETFRRCSMDRTQASYIAKRIGTLDGEFTQRSSYVSVELNPDHPNDAFACGFLGFKQREYDSLTRPKIKYRTDLVLPVIASRYYFGLSDREALDQNFFNYKGLDSNGDDWTVTTDAFHMDVDASSATVDGEPSVTFQTTIYGLKDVSDINDPINIFRNKRLRKFTLTVAGGFDGWDVYANNRSKGDSFRINGSGFINGGFEEVTLPNIEEGGTSDYYAFLNGILEYSNPEATTINILATPGLDYLNEPALINETVSMVEGDSNGDGRGDCLYIVTAPDVNGGVVTNPDADIEEAIDLLNSTDLDSSYVATYFPWIQWRDVENGVNIYLPPTLTVVRSMALTDKIAAPWFAPAGKNRGITNAVRARIKLTQAHRDSLYSARINPIATFTDTNVTIYGQKTLQIRESALDRINVRRLLLRARVLIAAVGQRLLFEQNDLTVRNQFLSEVNPILTEIKNQRGLLDFRVVLDDSPEALDTNELNGQIYIRPTKALEVINVTFNITQNGAFFANV